MALERLNKALAATGIASRRGAEKFILEGRIAVNGVTATSLSQRVDLKKDQLTLDGKPLKQDVKKYYILNKPRGYVCTAFKGKDKRVIDLFDGTERLFTVGRLDKETTGLLIVTNDGDFANEIIHPSKEIEKEYLVKTDHEISAELLKALSTGAFVEGTFVRPKKVTKVRRGTVKIVVGEGKKREIRVLVEKQGLVVLELKRIRIGNLMLGELPVGAYRPMKERDKELIFE